MYDNDTVYKKIKNIFYHKFHKYNILFRITISYCYEIKIINNLNIHFFYSTQLFLTKSNRHETPNLKYR